jgi:pyruvate dehydrogenase E1 component
MMECVDGEYQTFKSRDGSYVRKHFFGKYPELLEMVANMSDDDIWRLNRGGHDPHKVYAAYASAVNHTGQPTVILAKTIKGYGMGEAGEAQNITHQQKKMGTISLKSFRDRFHLPVPDNEIEDLPYLMFEEGSPELAYMKEKRNVLGGLLHKNQRQNTEALQIPALSAFDALLKASGEGRESSTTMVFVRILNILVKDKIIRKRIVPIVADESRTFGMEGMFRQLGIWSSKGQLYTPEDADKLMYYKEDKDGQILQEGINEAGAMSSWIAAATAYSTHGVQMIPFFIFYSMFGFQRIGDLAWAAADMRCRGFLMGGTAGRTTLNGEGLQHEDGHSHLLSSTIPNCISYDPTFSYELVVIIQDGMRRMYQEQEDVYYYITVMNENYSHPEMPKGSEEGILKGMYLFREGSEEREKNSNLRIQLLGSGTILREVIAAADILKEEYGIISDIWSVTSFNELRREALDATRWNMLHPAEKPKKSYVESCLEKREGPVVAATDYMKIFADQIREFVPGKYKVLGTDGFGRSDTREKLREFFEVDRYYVTVAALKSLEEDGKISSEKVVEAINKYNIDPDKPNPIKV